MANRPMKKMIALEEPESPSQDEPRVARVPREPTHKYIDAHEATHLPHEEWCEFCMAGRGRNRHHRRKRSEVGQEEPEYTLSDPRGAGQAPQTVGASDGPSAESAPQSGPVPRVCMDYFYVSSRPAGPTGGAQGMTTKELQKRLRELGKSTLGPRDVLMKRYQMYEGQEHQEELGLEMGPGIHAYERSMMVMFDETTGNKYMRSVKTRDQAVRGTTVG